MSVLTVLEKLGPHVEREVNLILKAEEEAQTLKSKLVKIQEGLEDAERQGVTELNVKRWLQDLEDVMYQMDDALDNWETKNLEVQIEQSEYDHVSDPWEKVRSLFVSLCFSFKQVVGRRALALEMKSLSARLDKILEERGKYNFASNKSDKSRKREKAETTSPLDKSKLNIGRQPEIDSVVELLLSQNGSKVISIVGVGGLGKTTLAQLIYNDPRVKDRFDLKAWVSVPDPFDAKKAAGVIAEAFDHQSSSGNSSLQNLGQRIKEVVSKKKNFLVVLDDVWTVDEIEWGSLKNFLVDEPGCRILVTTRVGEAARKMGSTHLRHLNDLSNSDCAAILNTIALKDRWLSEEEDEQFRKIGLNIANMCNGLPLAAETIGHMLESRTTVEEWEKVQESPLWKHEDEMSGTFRVLRLSYMDLSPILKRCFLCSALYSKGSEFDSEELTRIWMAQGCISPSRGWDEAHKQGKEYLKELRLRSFFQDVRRRGIIKAEENTRRDVITCKMHDVMHEFANYLARRDDCYLFINEERDGVNLELGSMGRTRNFCARSVSLEKFPPDFLRQLKRVRVLCLSECGLEEVSRGVGELIHLRYLDLSENPLKQLPETVCNLHNLQTLDLQWCRNLSKLPDGMRKLINLRHLLIYKTEKLREFPQGLEELSGLWTFKNFVATRDTVGYLRNLNQLRGCLEIIVEAGLDDPAEAAKANLREKAELKELRLSISHDVSMDVVEAMAPPPHLQTLIITTDRRAEIPQPPSWITSLRNLKKLKIAGFDLSHHLPPLGKLSKLEELQMFSVKFSSITLELLGGWPRLKILVFDGCRWWREWEDLQEQDYSAPTLFPCLKELQLAYCSDLERLPHRLLLAAKSLSNFTIRDCRELVRLYTGDDRDKIAHIPNLHLCASRLNRILNGIPVSRYNSTCPIYDTCILLHH